MMPRSAIEWLLAIDVAELSWEIQRYRILRHKLLESSRQQAIEAALRRIDMVGIAPDFEAEAEYHTRRNALSWRMDPIAAGEIHARLAAYASINMPSPLKSTSSRVRSWSCSKACSMPPKP
ncbi:MAG TPA: hypothetical protein VGE93_11450, partial [Bryobacteraceae bacterium]